MKIAIYGMGAIGSTFALKLSQAGHSVTAIARGKRLTQLEQDHAIVCTNGQRANVMVANQLDSTTEWDLVLVTVLAHQVDAILPALSASSAKAVMFMFNTVESLDRLRNAVGTKRFCFGFPAILAQINDGRLSTEIVSKGLLTTVTSDHWAKVFSNAGIPCVVNTDMESWLRTHAAFVVPFMILVNNAYSRNSGASWKESMDLALAMDEGFQLVRDLGNAITPTPMVAISRLPVRAKAALLWSVSRVKKLRQSGIAGPAEPQALIDAMSKIGSGKTSRLRAVRPD